MNRSLVSLYILAPLPTGAALAQSCPNRGQLDNHYCDADRDMAADAPTDKSKWKNPSTLIFTYTPIKDPAVYQKIFSNFLEHLAHAPARRLCITRYSQTLPRLRRCAQAAYISAGFPRARLPSR